MERERDVVTLTSDKNVWDEKYETSSTTHEYRKSEIIYDWRKTDAKMRMSTFRKRDREASFCVFPFPPFSAREDDTVSRRITSVWYSRTLCRDMQVAQYDRLKSLWHVVEEKIIWTIVVKIVALVFDDSLTVLKVSTYDDPSRAYV